MAILQNIEVMFNLLVLFTSMPLLSLVMSAPEYHNQFAIQVSGGTQRAEEVARRHDLEFRGPIGSLDNHYMLEASHLEKR